MRIHNPLFLVILASLVIGVTPSQAEIEQDQPSEATQERPNLDIGSAAENEPPSESEVSESESSSGLELSLADAVAMGIANNLTVEIERHAPLMAAEVLGSTKGIYDPEFFIDGGYADFDTPRAMALIGETRSTIEVQGWDGETGLRGIVPWLGAEYQLSYNASRTKTNSKASSLSPRYSTQAVGEVTLPLLRNLIWNEPWTSVHTSRALYAAEQERFRGVLMDTVLEIEQAYWDLIATAEQKRVAVKSLETARALKKQTETQYRVGVVSKVEVTESEAGVAEREVNLIVAENGYRSAQDQLIHLILAQELTASSDLEINPTDSLNDYAPYAVDIEVASQKAFANRPSIAASQHDVERLEFSLKHAKNQRLPQLDVSGSYGYEGLSGTPNPAAAAPVVVPDNYLDSHEHFGDNSGHRQWTTRGTFSIPLGNRTASHEVSRTGYELRRAKIEERRVHQNIVLEVREAVRNLESSLEGIEATERRRLAAAEQLRAERIRLENGESTPFDVLQRESDLVDAESEKIGALQLYRNSDASLDRAQGTILKNRNIRIEEASALR